MAQIKVLSPNAAIMQFSLYVVFQNISSFHDFSFVFHPVSLRNKYMGHCHGSLKSDTLSLSLAERFMQGNKVLKLLNSVSDLKSHLDFKHWRT